MDFIRSHKLIVATIAIQIIALPLILMAVKQNQDTRTQAAQSTTLFFTPSSTSSSPIQATVGQNLNLDLMLNPGNNLISFAKIEINYDKSLFTPDPANPVTINQEQDLKVVMEGPVVDASSTPGKILISISVGNNFNDALQTETKILTVNLKPIANSSQNTSVSIGASTRLLSSAAQDTTGENVLVPLSSLTPATIKISSTPTSTPTPTNAPTSTPTPTVTPTKTPTPTPTKTPTPIPTSTPTPTQPAPTLTIAPVSLTTFNITGLKLHGIGKGGDNPNPTSTGNLSPLRTTRPIAIKLFNASSTLVQTLNGNITYTGATTGVFNGKITVPDTTNIPETNYTVKITVPYYKTQTLPGIISLVKGGTFELTPVALTAGDTDQDGVLEAADDYAIIIDCYSDIQAAKNCNATKKMSADITDDGQVDEEDYNLFIRELSVQAGD